MSVLQDPTGATFSVWESKTHPGTGITGVPGTLCWVDISTSDAERAKQFYSELFGWHISPGRTIPRDTCISRMAMISSEGSQQPSNGIRMLHPTGCRILTVADVDASTAKTKELGGNVHMEPISMENVGRFAVLGDPQGAVFAIFKAAHRG